MNTSVHKKQKNVWASATQSLWLGAIIYGFLMFDHAWLDQGTSSNWPAFLTIISVFGILASIVSTRRFADRLGLLWLVIAGLISISFIFFGLGWFADDFANWVLFPSLLLLIAIHLCMSPPALGLTLAVRTSNTWVIIGIAILVGQALEFSLSDAAALWFLIVASLVLFLVSASLLHSKRTPLQDQKASKIQAHKRFLTYLGPLLFATWLAAVLTWIFADVTPNHSAINGFLPAIFTIATMMGCGLAYRGIGRFGPYRHLCQAALLAMLLSISLTLPHQLWSWLVVSCMVLYLAGTMLTALICLWFANTPESQSLAHATGFCFLIFLGTWFGLLADFNGMTNAGFWLLAMLLFGALMALQQLIRHVHISAENAESSQASHANWLLPPIQVKGAGRHDFFSRFSRRCARIIAEIFFGRIRIEGAENLQLNTGAILVANHPNTFLDPLIITALSPGRLHYWAKSTLWKLPILGSILDRMGAIPVFRRKDAAKSHSHQSDNQLSIALAARKVNKGGWLLIFPEGGSHSGLSIKPLKTGSARVAFRALEENEWEEEIAILPVALDYLEPSIFRSNLTIRIGKPIYLKPYRDMFQENPPAAVIAVTDKVSVSLQSLLPHLQDPELEQLVHQVGHLYGDHLCQIMGEADVTKARKAISEAVDHYQQIDADTLLLFNQRMNTYFQEKSRLRTPEHHPPIPLKELIRILSGLFSFVTFGILANWIPYRLVRKIVAILDPSPVWLGTAKLACGAVIFWLYYFLCGLVSYRLFGGLVAFLLIASFAVSAFIALGALDRFAFRAHQLKLIWQAFWTQDTNDDLEEMKVSLIQDLERFREAYAFYRDQSQVVPSPE